MITTGSVGMDKKLLKLLAYILGSILLPWLFVGYGYGIYVILIALGMQPHDGTVWVASIIWLVSCVAMFSSYSSYKLDS